jgi:putative toxin-antitoxin system antitoxin component (TIGR02293 family)
MNVAVECPKLWKLAVHVFGDEEKATVWLHTRLSELEDKTPSEVLAKSPESLEVEAILERIEYGVFN